ncbi:MAG TPA: hypothetical protein VFG83_07555 [Kofleriaceae bacterium]|nr:hypothetical protein [Kofleriaceae bacterium]
MIAVALVHVVTGSLPAGARARPWWLSVASGISIAYVFVHLLPDLSEAQARWLEVTPHRPFYLFHSQVYVVALAGVLIAVGVGRVTAPPGMRHRRFWIHTGSFALYNLLIGLFASQITHVAALIFALLAFGAHFLVSDYNLHVEFRRDYERSGRWVLAAAIVLGWLIETLWNPPVVVVSTLLALVAGEMILNVIKEEIPGKREGRFAAFAGGAMAYTLLLLLLARTQLRG